MLCPFCEKSDLEFAEEGDDIYSHDHFACPRCCSTYADLEDAEWYKKEKAKKGEK